MTQVTANIPHIIIEEENKTLNAPIHMKELEEAIFQMKEGTASELDLFTINFFHEFWDIIEDDILGFRKGFSLKLAMHSHLFMLKFENKL